MLLEFMGKLSRFPGIPEGATEDDISRVSFILQEATAQRLHLIPNKAMRFQVHHMLCFLLNKFFDSINAVSPSFFKKKTIESLALSEYAGDPICSNKHVELANKLAKQFEDKKNQAPPATRSTIDNREAISRLFNMLKLLQEVFT